LEEGEAFEEQEEHRTREAVAKARGGAGRRNDQFDDVGEDWYDPDDTLFANADQAADECVESGVAYDPRLKRPERLLYGRGPIEAVNLCHRGELEKLIIGFKDLSVVAQYVTEYLHAIVGRCFDVSKHLGQLHQAYLRGVDVDEAIADATFEMEQMFELGNERLSGNVDRARTAPPPGTTAADGASTSPSSSYWISAMTDWIEENSSEPLARPSAPCETSSAPRRLPSKPTSLCTATMSAGGAVEGSRGRPSTRNRRLRQRRRNRRLRRRQAKEEAEGSEPDGTAAVLEGAAVVPEPQVPPVRGPWMSPREAPGWRDDTHRGKMQAWWVRQGVHVEFAPGVKPRAFHKAPSSWMDQDHWMERKVERDRCLKNGAFAAAESQDVTELLAKGCMICPAFVVPKKGSTNRWRLVVDEWLLLTSYAKNGGSNSRDSTNSATWKRRGCGPSRGT
jgi:hypothetical protein